ncbi:MAG TPA: hypothetical protein HPP76_09170 [Desulfuromonadales bacterium]|nr:hypothetical protein [Desulfuromonadales bacterium]
MKKLCMLFLIFSVLTTPAFAARQVYLKDGGVISAKSVWRTKGKVHVLVNRDTLTEFSTSEINLKRTFPRRRAVAKQPVQNPVPVAAGTVQATPAAAPQPAAEKKSSLSLPSLPKLSEKNPESLLPSSGSGGTIKQHKKEMAEKAGE